MNNRDALNAAVKTQIAIIEASIHFLAAVSTGPKDAVDALVQNVGMSTKALGQMATVVHAEAPTQLRSIPHDRPPPRKRGRKPMSPEQRAAAGVRLAAARAVKADEKRRAKAALIEEGARNARSEWANNKGEEIALAAQLPYANSGARVI